MRPLLLIALVLSLFSCGGADLRAELAPPEPDAEPSSVKMATQNTNGDVAAEDGFIADGASITVPTGFTAEQCVFTASLASVSGEAVSTRVSVNRTTGEVSCKAVVQEGDESQPEEKSCSASYIVVCAK